MLNNILVAIAITAGVIAIAGVPLRAWQFHTGHFRSQIPRHAFARATFTLFAAAFLLPNLIAWAYALYIAYADFTCVEACAPARIRSAVAVGMLGCTYALLEGFLLTACHRGSSGPSPQDTRDDQKSSVLAGHGSPVTPLKQAFSLRTAAETRQRSASDPPAAGD